MEKKLSFTGLAVLLAFTGLAVLLALAVALPVAAKGVYSFTFNESLKPFTAVTNDLNKSYEFQLLREAPAPTLCFGCPPNGFAGLKLVPSSTESGVWMVTNFSKGSGADQVRISFDAKDVQDCTTCMPMVYTGTTPPTKASDFSLIGSAKLTKGWQALSYTTIVKSAEESPFYVALGWRVKDDMLKIKSEAGFDNINVMVAPAP